MIDFHPHSEACYRCHAVAWETTGDTARVKGKPHDVVACVFCGARLRVEAAVRQAAAPPAERNEFRFQYGRFKGMTFAEAEAEPNGRRYLEHVRDTNEKLRGRIEEYLAASSA